MANDNPKGPRRSRHRKRGDPAADQRRALIKEAASARQRAVAPYSRFKVGVALLTEDGQMATGANVESVSYGLSCCAERVALLAALTAGMKRFVAMAIVARADGGVMPCGACRQLLAEYAPQAKIWVADSRALGVIREFSVAELLPDAFAAIPTNSD